MKAQQIILKKKTIWALFTEEVVFRFDTLSDLLDFTFSTFGMHQEIILDQKAIRWIVVK